VEKNVDNFEDSNGYWFWLLFPKKIKKCSFKILEIPVMCERVDFAGFLKTRLENTRFSVCYGAVPFVSLLKKPA